MTQVTNEKCIERLADADRPLNETGPSRMQVTNGTTIRGSHHVAPVQCSFIVQTKRTYTAVTW